MTYRLSIQERIALTQGLRPGARAVLSALARYADFESGRNARPTIATLVELTSLSRSQVAWWLQWLEAEGWVIGVHRHRHAATYHLCLDRLATSATRAKLVERFESGIRIQTPADHDLSPESGFKSEKFESGFRSVESGIRIQNTDLSPETRHHPVCTEVPRLYDPSAPALIAPAEADGRLAAATTTTATEAAEGGESGMAGAQGPTLAARAGDVSTNRGDRARDLEDVSAPLGLRTDGTQQGGTSEAEVRIQQPTDSQSGGRVDGPRPQEEPHQLTFGPQDVKPERAPQWGQIAEAFKTALKRQTG